MRITQRHVLLMLTCLTLLTVGAIGCDRDRDRDDDVYNESRRDVREMRLTEGNFRQLQEDMSLADIQAILGPGQRVTPVTSEGDGEDVLVTYRWSEEGREVVVTFENGRAEKITKVGF